VAAILDAVRSPVERPFDERKLRRFHLSIERRKLVPLQFLRKKSQGRTSSAP
jgi:hypothetical protein